MSDLVAELRGLAAANSNGASRVLCACGEAANEIERLRETNTVQIEHWKAAAEWSANRGAALLQQERQQARLLRSALGFALREAKRTPFNAEEYDAASALLADQPDN